MKKIQSSFKWDLFLILSVYLSPAHADSNYFPLMYRNTFQGAIASSTTIGKAESMVPFYGNPEDHIVFVDLAGAYDSQDAYQIGPGIGLRYARNNQIFGAYLFGDFTRTHCKGKRFVFNPGVEWMGPEWDLHINGYFPTQHQKNIKNLGFASTQGNYDFIFFQGHQSFDQKLNEYDIVGTGVDAELGHLFVVSSMRHRIFIGGYFFGSSHGVSSITGIEAGAEISVFPRISFIIAGSHDNIYKNKALFSVRLNFGSPIDHYSDDVRDRFVDPIPRHLATLYTAASVPCQKAIKNTGESVLFGDHIWFFREGSNTATSVTINECTYANPCIGINSNIISSIDSLDDNAIFYFAPGTYYPVALPNPAPGTLTLQNGQTFWGRTNDYRHPANGADRAMMLGVMQLPGNNRLDSLQVVNDSVTEILGDGYGPNITGVHVLGTTGKVTLNNVNIQTSSNNAANNGAISVFAEGSSPVVITNSTLNAVETSLTSTNGAENIAIVGNNNLTLTNSTLNASVLGNIPAYNVYNQTSSSIMKITNVTMTANSGGIGAAGNVFLNAPSTATLTNVNLTATATDPNNPEGAENVILDQNSNATVNDSVLTATNSSTNPFSSAININNFLATSVVNNTQMNATDNNGDFAAGVYLTNGSTTVNNSVMNIVENGGNPNANGFGVYSFGGILPEAIIQNSTVNVTANSNGVETAGLFLITADGTVNNSTLNITQLSTGWAAGFNATQSTGTFNNTKVNVQGTNAAQTFGILSIVNSNVGSINNTSYHITNTNGLAFGAETDATSHVGLQNNSLTITSQTAQAAGIINNGTMTITNSDFVINGNNTSTFNLGANPPTQSGGSCEVNGNPC